MRKYYSPYQFSFLRILTGVFSAVYFFQYIPYVGELFGNEGLSPKLLALDAFTQQLFPGFLHLLGQQEIVLIFVFLILVSLSLALGFFRNISALIIWLGLALMVSAVPIFFGPSLPFFAWLLLAFVIVPSGEPLSLSDALFKKEKKRDWYVPWILYWGGWVVLGTSFFIGFLAKMLTEAWVNGFAFLYMFQLSLAYDWWLHSFLLDILPIWVFQVLTWTILLTQGLVLLFFMFKGLRFTIWLFLVGEFVIALIFFNFWEILVMVLLFYFFLFDSEWFLKKKGEKKEIFFFDGNCGLCSRFVRFVSREDLYKKIYFSQFQGKTIHEYLSEEEIKDMSSMVFIDSEHIVHRKSDAFIAILKTLGGIWFLLAFLIKIIPRTLRDFIYIKISQKRHLLITNVFVENERLLE